MPFYLRSSCRQGHSWAKQMVGSWDLRLFPQGLERYVIISSEILFLQRENYLLISYNLRGICIEPVLRILLARPVYWSNQCQPCTTSENFTIIRLVWERFNGLGDGAFHRAKSSGLGWLLGICIHFSLVCFFESCLVSFWDCVVDDKRDKQDGKCKDRRCNNVAW